MCYVCYQGARVAEGSVEATEAVSGTESSEPVVGTGSSGGLESLGLLSGVGSSAVLMFLTLFVTFSLGINLAVRSFNRYYH